MQLDHSLTHSHRTGSDLLVLSIPDLEVSRGGLITIPCPSYLLSNVSGNTLKNIVLHDTLRV